MNMKEQAEDVGKRSLETVSEHPFSASAIAFGVGLGFGLTVASVLIEAAGAHQKRPQHYAEQFGHSFMDAVMKAVPDSVAKRLHS